VELSGADQALAAQRRYARWLVRGTRLGLVLLVLGFAAYATGLVAPHVPIERLPSLWRQAASNLLDETGVRAGWGWAELLHRSDMIALAGIALLASCSIPCLAAAMPVFKRRGETIFVAICILQIAVLVLAASGILVSAH
jgi:hypothetical protein